MSRNQESKRPDALRAAVIGAGAMGRNHVRVLSELAGVQLVGVADPDPERRKSIEARFQTRTFEDHRELLAETRPRMVCVVVPSQLHLAVTLDSLAAGANVLVEKPIASTVAEGREMIEAANAAGLALTVGHIERFNPAILELRRRLAAGELGRVFKVEARRMGPFPARVRDVGVVVDLGTHDIDIMRWLVGKPVVRLHAETARRIHTDHEDLFCGMMRFEDGAIGLLNINWLTPTKVRDLTVTGERGMFRVNYLTQELYFYENGEAGGSWDALGVLTGVSEGNMTRLQIHRREPLAVELESFAEALRSGGRPMVSGEDGLAALAIARAFVTSGREGRLIRFEDEHSVAATPEDREGGVAERAGGVRPEGVCT